MCNGSQHLCCANIGAAKHSNSTVGVWQGCGPLDGVVAVVGFVFEGVPLAFGGIASAHVLNDDDVSARRASKTHAYFIVFVVGSPLQEHRKFAIGFGTEDVGVKSYAVTHFYGNVVLVGNGVRFGGPGEARK